MAEYRSVDKIDDLGLVQLVLGKKQADEDCRVIAEAFLSDGFITEGPVLAYEPSATLIRKVNKVQAAIELGRRSMQARALRDITTISVPEDVVKVMAPIYAGALCERFHVLNLSTKNRLIKLVEVSVGSLNASIVHPRELFSTAVRLGAASVIVTHNHPSGDSTPSGADIQLTRRLVKAGDVLGIQVLDHVVVGGGGEDFTSLHETGLM